MYSKQSAAFLRKQFWTNFGQYLAPIPAAAGNKINWINYKTGARFINFKMDASDEQAYIGIEISHNDVATQQLFFSHFKTLRPELEDAVAEKWIWKEAVPVNGKNISRIYTTLHNINIYQQDDWPAIITFLKNRIIVLDHFWNDHKDIFEMIA
ncbi:MAG: DUF4268 domain-containing protein [Ferruginibacter sp.]